MTAVEVRLHGEPVGELRHRSSAGDATIFGFYPSYLESPSRPVLGQWFEEDPTRAWKTTHRVPPWFSNLLPEGRLRELLAHQAGVHDERELHLLAALGEDLPGAVTVHPLDEALDDAPLVPRPPVPEGERLHFSLAGLQLKFPVEKTDRGLTVPVRGRGGRWIAKLPDLRFVGVPENEHVMLTLARSVGLTVPDHELVGVDEIDGLPSEVSKIEGRALLLRRFDRPDHGPAVHMEDFAQVLGCYPHDKYRTGNFETIGRILQGLAPADTEEFVARLVFMVLTGNADAHLKNWSILYPDRIHGRLAPAYDLVATVAFPGVDDQMALKLCKTRAFDRVDEGCIRRLADKIGAEREALVARARHTSSELRRQLPDAVSVLPGEQAVHLRAHLARCRL